MKNTQKNQKTIVSFKTAEQGVKQMWGIINDPRNADIKSDLLDYYKSTMKALTVDQSTTRMEKKVMVFASMFEGMPESWQVKEGFASAHKLFFQNHLFDVASNQATIGAAPSLGERLQDFMQESTEKVQEFWGKISNKVAALDL